jgi:hypothetical protein
MQPNKDKSLMYTKKVERGTESMRINLYACSVNIVLYQATFITGRFGTEAESIMVLGLW